MAGVCPLPLACPSRRLRGAGTAQEGQALPFRTRALLDAALMQTEQPQPGARVDPQGGDVGSARTQGSRDAIRSRSRRSERRAPGRVCGLQGSSALQAQGVLERARRGPGIRSPAHAGLVPLCAQASGKRQRSPTPRPFPPLTRPGGVGSGAVWTHSTRARESEPGRRRNPPWGTCNAGLLDKRVHTTTEKTGPGQARPWEMLQIWNYKTRITAKFGAGQTCCVRPRAPGAVRQRHRV